MIAATPRREVAVSLALFLGALCAAPSGLAALQQGADAVSLAKAPAPAPPSAGGWAAFGLNGQSWSTSLALQVTIPAGSAMDAEGVSGTAWLLGEAVQSELLRRLESDAPHIDIEVRRGSTTIRMLVLSDAWQRSVRALEDVLFSPSWQPELDQGARLALSEVFAFEGGLPRREFDLELHLLLSGGNQAWSTDPRGSADGIDHLGTSDLVEFRRRHYRKETAVLTAAGAVDPTALIETVAGPTTTKPGTTYFAVGDHSRSGSDRPAWVTGERQRLVREITSAWIGAAYPIAPETDHTALEFFIHRVRGELITDPPAPGLFSATVEVEELPDGSKVLLITAAVLPENMASWENRIVRAVDRVRSENPAADFYQAYRRQFRSVRLLADGSLEDQAARSGADLLREGRIRALSPEISAIELADVQAAAAGLGEPRILVFGPDLAASEPSSR